ncbi:hypothetical protein D9M71_648490 [compost metagenome]
MQAQAEQNGEEQYRQQFTARHRGQNVFWNDPEDQAHETMALRCACSSLLELRDICVTELRNISTRPWLHDVAKDQAQDNRNSGDDLEVNNGLEANSPQRLTIANASDTYDHAGEYDGHHHHFDHADK